MLSSVDGKISTGVDPRDTEIDFPKIKGIKEGLYQYSDLEKKTDIVSFNTGKVMAKIGMNTNKCKLDCPGVNFVIVDGKHLSESGVKNLIKKTKRLFLVTSNPKHPGFKLKDELELLYYPKKVDFKDLFRKLKTKYSFNRVTIQSGGTMNSILIRAGLIDIVSFVFAPALIGGSNTPSLIDGSDLKSLIDVKQIKSLKLLKCEKLKHSYVWLKYSVQNF